MGRFDSLTQLTPPADRSSHPAAASSTTPAAIRHRTVPASVASPTTTRRRDKIRHPFEIYQDQLDTLRKRAYQERLAGKLGSMSQMVREALDSYLNKPSTTDD